MKRGKSEQPALPAEGAPLVNRLGLQFMGKVEQEASHPNLLFSPLSLTLCLAITYNGAAGATRDELARVLGIEGLAEEEVNRRFAELRSVVEHHSPRLALVLANAVWAVRPQAFAADFVYRIQQFYDAEAYTLDTAGPRAAEAINGWVCEKTKENITTLVEPGDVRAGASCVLTNAIFFKGVWSDPFDPRATSDRPFSMPGGPRRNVPMMSRTGHYPYLESKSFQAIALPYDGGTWNMYVFLPRKDTRLDLSGWTEWPHPFQDTHVQLALPRFSVVCTLDLMEPLCQLGLANAFQPGADFTRMGILCSYISRAKQKARVDVNEEGTVAAASTAVVLGRSFVPVTVMTVDRPFYLAIRDDRTGCLLFVGEVTAPASSESGG